MRLLALLAASCFLTLGALKADAAVVSFQGTIETGGLPDGFSGTPIFGTIPVPDAPRSFTLQLNYTPGGIAGITSGSFNVDGGVNFAVVPVDGVTLSTILVSPAASPAADMASFTVNVNGPVEGLLTFSFSRDAIAAGGATEANIDAIVLGNTSASLIANFGLSGAYTGNITGVPEPSSCLALLGLVGGAWGWRRRQQRRAA